ncbi:MAG: glycosyltransferase [Thermoanaerobaculia bacterium]|nr:glycosyltransferase [Thermoanaerobaculia bacterium]
MDEAPAVTLVVPARDAEENVGPLVHEVEVALDAGGVAFELVVVDDGSRDRTAEGLAFLAASRPWMRPLRLGNASGKSAALRAGILAARADVVATTSPRCSTFSAGEKRTSSRAGGSAAPTGPCAKRRPGWDDWRGGSSSATARGTRGAACAR